MALLDSDRVTIGRAPESDVRLPDDPRVSRLHAILERYGSDWCVRDLGSSNGTFVNGKRIASEQRLSPGDEIRIGGSTAVFRRTTTGAEIRTLADDPPPELTRKEREVLIALCRPLGQSQEFPEPATVGQLAAELVLSPATVKFHLLNLYAKFDIAEGSSRRLRLANEAFRRGAVSRADLLAPTQTQQAAADIGHAGPS